jgi:hypothetical protein
LVTDGATVLGPGESARIDVRLDANAFIRTETHFQLEGLPQPLVGSFNPDAVTAQLPSTVLTVTAPPGTPPGTYGSIEVSAFLLGEKVARRSLTFSVVERDFSLDVSPGAVDFTTSGTVYLSLSATPSNGFQGTVLLALGELPDDVRIVQPLTSSSLIVIAGGSTVSSLGLGFAPTPPVPTSASFVLTATSPDGPSHSRTVTVNYPSVTTPGFTLAADRTELVLTPGGTDTATVTVGGAPAPVQLAASGLPAGVIATFDPAEVTGTGTSLLTVQASAQAIPGPPATFYLYGSTASGLSQSVPLTISIIPR